VLQSLGFIDRQNVFNPIERFYGEGSPLVAKWNGNSRRSDCSLRFRESTRTVVEMMGDMKVVEAKNNEGTARGLAEQRASR
jgi:hypothetical protein